MLVGQFYSKVDDKNRLALPKKFRENLGGNIIITRGYEGCLVIVSPKQWEALLKIFKDKPFTRSDVRDTRRFLIGGADEANLDKLGRFVLPKNLILHASLKKDVIVLGLIDWIEVWDQKKWNEKEEFLKKNSSWIAEKLEEAVPKDK